jgi:hypothetical protein
MKAICAAVAVILLAPQQQKSANSDLKYDQAAGISVQKPPKNDEWDFKEKDAGAFWKACKILVVHKVDELKIEVDQSPAAEGIFDAKKQAETDWNSITEATGVSEPKKIAINNTKLPGNGAGGANAAYLECTFKRSDKLVEFRQWLFVGRENQLIYRVIVHGDEGMYKKHQKVADYILASVKTWKLPKN